MTDTATPTSAPRTPTGRAAMLVHCLQLSPHPEGGFYREIFRSLHSVTAHDPRGPRSALTSIDFLLIRGQFSAWHRVESDEAWHLLEGDGLRLWLIPPSLDRIEAVDLGLASEGRAPRHIVPAHWWQAAEPLADFAYCGATVGPGFEFADFSFLRSLPDAGTLLDRLDIGLKRLL